MSDSDVQIRVENGVVRVTRFLWIALILLLGLGALVCWLLNRPFSTRAITVSFVGYTNATNSAWRFALFSLTNRDRVAVRPRGLSVEVEGNTNLKAPTVNPSLPWINRGSSAPLAWKNGEGVIFAVGEPVQAGRWRVQVRFSRSTIKEKLFQFGLTHRLPSFVAKCFPGPPPIKTTTSEWVP